MTMASLCKEKMDAMVIQMELHHITLTGYPQRPGEDGQPPNDQGVSSPLPGAHIVGVLVEELAVDGAPVLLPLVFDVDEGPLSAAEGEVL